MKTNLTMKSESNDLDFKYNHMNFITFFKSFFDDWVFLAGFSGSILGFVPSMFINIQPVINLTIQILSGAGGVTLLGISIYTKIIEARTQRLQYEKEKRQHEKELQIELEREKIRNDF